MWPNYSQANILEKKNYEANVDIPMAKKPKRNNEADVNICNSNLQSGCRHPQWSKIKKGTDVDIHNSKGVGLGINLGCRRWIGILWG